MKFWIGVWFILGLGMGWGGYRLWQYDQIPVMARNREQDAQVVLGGRTLRNPTATPLGMLKYNGAYMTFLYPAKAKRYPLKKADASILERVDWEIENPRISIVAIASRISETRVDEVPGVMARRAQKDKYREQMVQIGPEKNPVFTSIDGKEKVAFVMYHERLYTLAIYGSDAEEIKILWQQVLPTFHFI